MTTTRPVTMGDRWRALWGAQPVHQGLTVTDVLAASSILAVGLIVGGGLALLLASTSGSAKRQEIAHQANKVGATLRGSARRAEARDANGWDEGGDRVTPPAREG